MNRMDEYNELLAELDETPPRLEYTVSRAEARTKRVKRRLKFFTVPASGIVSLFVVFVILINASTPFAMACSRIPILRELGAAVALSPSLKAAVENEYVQLIGQEQTENGITFRIEYLIVDQKQLNIFYSLESDIYSWMDVTPSIRATDGKTLEACTVWGGGGEYEKGELKRITIDFIDKDMPDGLILTCKVQGNNGPGFAEEQAPPTAYSEDIWEPQEHTEPEYVSTFEFLLEFDPSFTQQGETITINQGFVLDGQTLTVTTVDIYPTHIRINLADVESNTAWLHGMDFYLENEKGEIFESIGGGIIATGSVDSPMMDSHRLESSFFSESKSLTLYITWVEWLDKDMERVKLDLANNAAEVLPEGVSLLRAVRSGGKWILSFEAVEREENASYQLFRTKYYDEAGNEYEYNAWSSGSSGYYDEEKGEYVDTPGRFLTEFALRDYPYDTVWLSPIYSRTFTAETPVAIRVK